MYEHPCQRSVTVFLLVISQAERRASVFCVRMSSEDEKPEEGDLLNEQWIRLQIDLSQAGVKLIELATLHQGADCGASAASPRPATGPCLRHPMSQVSLPIPWTWLIQ